MTLFSNMTDRSTQTALSMSILLHVIIVILSVVGLPWIKKAPPAITPPPSIAIEFVSAKKGRVKQSDVKKRAVAPKPPPASKPKPPPPPKMTDNQAPDLSKVKAPPVKVDEPPPPKEAKAVPTPNKEKKEAVKTEDNNLTKRAASQNDQQFSSLLKNLMDTPEPEEDERSFEDLRKELADKSIPEPEEDVAEDKQENDLEPVIETDTRAMDDIISDLQEGNSDIQSQGDVLSLDSRLNLSEVSVVKQQLAGCWNVLSGARYAENLTVAVELFMNPDRTVRNAVIVDQLRYSNDRLFRAAADSALRALRMDGCRVLNLPPQKYDQWKKTIITFDPRSML